MQNLNIIQNEENVFHLDDLVYFHSYKSLIFFFLLGKFGRTLRQKL